jgi:hypothetical protein
MKKKTLFLFLLPIFSFVLSFAQAKISVKELYAYKQANLPGIQPNTSEGEGVKETKTTYNYLFYFISPRSEKTTVTELWISGEKFIVKSETIKKTPVYKISYTAASGNDSLTLVPFTKNNVLLVYPSGKVKGSATMSKYLSDLISKHELVITYYRNGRKYYKVIKKITELEPVARM